MTDIATIVSSNRDIEILHPATKKKLGVRIDLVSIDNERLAAKRREITNRRLYLEQRNKSFTADELEENKIGLLFASMIGWEWYAQPAVIDEDTGITIEEAQEQPVFEGEVPEFNLRNVKRVFKKLSWFADQVFEAVGETEAFFNTSKAN